MPFSVSFSNSENVSLLRFYAFLGKTGPLHDTSLVVADSGVELGKASLICVGSCGHGLQEPRGRSSAMAVAAYLYLLG